MTELSHDSLEGRATFTPGLEKAARLIEREYARAGLKPVPGLLGGVTGYRQRYVMYRYARGRVAGLCNGRVLSEGEALGLGPAGPRDLSTAAAEDIRVARVRRGENLLGRLRSLSASGQPSVLLVDTSLAAQFRALRAVARPSFTRLPELKAPVVAVLTSETELRSLDVTVTAGVDSLVATNVLGMIEGRERPAEWVMFTAHYDHIGIIPPVNGDSIANGADDDGTGTTGVVALAHALSREAAAGRGPSRSVIFACFSGEELGLLGSQHFAGTLPDPAQVVAGFNLEMLGKPSPRGPNTAWISGWDKTNFGPLLNRALRDAGQPEAFFADPYPSENIWQRSDHYSLARRGIPAHIIMSDAFDQDRYYHTVDDEISTLDLAHYTAIVNTILLASRPTLSGLATPSRVKE